MAMEAKELKELLENIFRLLEQSIRPLDPSDVSSFTDDLKSYIRNEFSVEAVQSTSESEPGSLTCEVPCRANTSAHNYDKSIAVQLPPSQTFPANTMEFSPIDASQKCNETIEDAKQANDGKHFLFMF